MRSPVIIMVSKEEILSEDVSRVRRILDSYFPTLVDRNRNRVTIVVNGYNEDPREVFLINDVRKWFHHLFDAVPEFFFWMYMHPPWLTFYAIMFGTPAREQGGTTMSSDDLQHFLIWGYHNLNEFCSARNISPDLSTDHIRRAIEGETIT